MKQKIEIQERKFKIVKTIAWSLLTIQSLIIVAFAILFSEEIKLDVTNHYWEPLRVPVAILIYLFALWFVNFRLARQLIIEVQAYLMKLLAITLFIFLPPILLAVILRNMTGIN